MTSQVLSESVLVDEDLSDEQIEQLLQQAEARLRGETLSDSLVPSIRSFLAQGPKLQTTSLPAPPVQKKGSITRANPGILVDETQRKAFSHGVRKVEDPVTVREEKFKTKTASSGPKWYNMPRTVLTPQLKRDLQVIRMRNVLDPHRHYKKDNNRPSVPGFSQVGTMIEGPTEYFSARIPKRQRERTLVESVMAAEKESGRMKKKYGEIQDKKASGKKGHYRKMMERRYKGKMKR